MHDTIEKLTQSYFDSLMDAHVFDGTLTIAITACYFNVVKEVEKCRDIKPKES